MPSRCKEENVSALILGPVEHIRLFLAGPLILLSIS